MKKGEERKKRGEEEEKRVKLKTLKKINNKSQFLERMFSNIDN